MIWLKNCSFGVRQLSPTRPLVFAMI
jgi:hypothetical protein